MGIHERRDFLLIAIFKYIQQLFSFFVNFEEEGIVFNSSLPAVKQVKGGNESIKDTSVFYLCLQGNVFLWTALPFVMMLGIGDVTN